MGSNPIGVMAHTFHQVAWGVIVLKGAASSGRAALLAFFLSLTLSLTPSSRGVGRLTLASFLSLTHSSGGVGGDRAKGRRILGTHSTPGLLPGSTPLPYTLTPIP